MHLWHVKKMLPNFERYSHHHEKYHKNNTCGVLHNISLEMNNDVNELPAVQEDEIIISNDLPPAEAREAGV